MTLISFQVAGHIIFWNYKYNWPLSPKYLHAAIGHSILCQAFQALFITRRFELLCVSFDLDDIEKY